jgi:hypothetical protein
MNEPAKSATPLSLPNEEPLRSSRLSIADLLLITQGAAISIWIMQPPEGPRATAFVAVSVLMAPLYGACIAAVLRATWRMLIDAPPVAAQPGHRFLFVIGTMFCGIGLVAKSLPGIYLYDQPHAFVEVLAVVMPFGVCLIVLSIGLLTSTLFTIDSQPRHWQRVYWLFAWTVFLGVIGPCLIDIGGASILALILAVVLLTPPILVLVTTIAAVTIDVSRREYRDHWHWLGVAAFLGLPAHFVLMMIAGQFT